MAFVSLSTMFSSNKSLASVFQLVSSFILKSCYRFQEAQSRTDMKEVNYLIEYIDHIRVHTSWEFKWLQSEGPFFEKKKRRKKQKKNNIYNHTSITSNSIT
ncbi:hypothetical protein ATANTOWER_007400 [Ataeniobius toweri]|uniref:Uncharacterized protein n=1 Tax=Ataeniobius toweri TaxID=208326 RepID=A0ABU7BY09_9TELE|nr:hypothetical protein [Ataeniobius toweri]